MVGSQQRDPLKLPPAFWHPDAPGSLQQPWLSHLNRAKGLSLPSKTRAESFSSLPVQKRGRIRGVKLLPSFLLFIIKQQHELGFL